MSSVKKHDNAKHFAENNMKNCITFRDTIKFNWHGYCRWSLLKWLTLNLSHSLSLFIYKRESVAHVHVNAKGHLIWKKSYYTSNYPVIVWNSFPRSIQYVFHEISADRNIQRVSLVCAQTISWTNSDAEGEIALCHSLDEVLKRLSLCLFSMALEPHEILIIICIEHLLVNGLFQL